MIAGHSPAFTYGLAELDAQLDAGATTPTALVTESLLRAEASQATFTVLLQEQAAAAAAAATERRRGGRKLSAIDGVPVAVKDCFDVKGVVTGNGSALARASGPADEDAVIVAQLRKAGAVIVGKTNQSELAFSGLGLNPHFGTPPNPLSSTEPLVPGGSSSGSAVAVATGIVPLALGSDTSGSVRIPAAFCGLVGYKASEGTFSTKGMTPLAPTLDTVGLLVPALEDLAIVVEALRSTGGNRTACACHEVVADPGGRIRIVIPEGELLEDCDPVIRQAFESDVSMLADRPEVTVERRSIRALQRAQTLMDRHGTIVAAEAFALYGRLADQPGPPALDPAIARRLRSSALASRSVSSFTRELVDLRRTFTDELDGAMLCCPTVRHLPPTIADARRSADCFDALNARTLRTTMLLSVLGAPGVTTPSRSVAAAGVLFSTSPHSDQRLLRDVLRISG